MLKLAIPKKESESEGGMTVSSNDEKLKELVKLMSQYSDENPLAMPLKTEGNQEADTKTDFTVIETSRTVTYSQKGWRSYGELVRNTK